MKELRCEGYQVDFKSAKSPSDTIWLNRGISKKSQCGRILLAVVIVLVCSIVVFFMFDFEISTESYINYRIKPLGVSCDDLNTKNINGLTAFMAAVEYAYLQNNGFTTLNDQIPQFSALPCFCSQEKENGSPSDKVYTISTPKGTIEAPICEN